MPHAHYVRMFAACLAIGATGVLAARAPAGPGDLDSTFGSDGIVLTKVREFGSEARDIAVLPDGRILVAGSAEGVPGNENFVVVRYDTDGSIDQTFGLAGVAETDVSPGGDDVATAMVVQPDGRIVVVGSASAGVGLRNIALVRYDADGTLDSTFDSDGVQTTALPGLNGSARAVALQSDGKIVVVGATSSQSSPAGSGAFVLARYDPNGTLDPGFGTGGVVGADITSASDILEDVAIQSDGKIVAVGHLGAAAGAGLDFAVARYETDGTPDGSFGTGGLVATDVSGDNDLLYAVALQTDSKILVSGAVYDGSPYAFALARYDTAGVLDSTFGDEGVSLSTLLGANEQARDVAVRDDGTILAAGETRSSTDVFAIAQFHGDGTLDASFSDDGWTATTVGTGWSDIAALAIQPDGKVVVAGRGRMPNTYHFGVARYEAGPGLCGNGIIDYGEVCDDLGASAACDVDCTTPLCGDAVPNAAAGEDCDVGTPEPIDCCTALCAFPGAGTECDDGRACTFADSCDGLGSCVPGGPAPCFGGFEKATMLIDERIPQRKIVKVKLKNGPLLEKDDFGDPSQLGGTSYLMCFWDDADELVGDLAVDRAGLPCGNQSCWVERKNAWHFRQKSGITLRRLKLNGGPAGKSSVQYVNVKTSDPFELAAGLVSSSSAKMQILSSDAACVEGTVDEVKKQESDFFKAVRK